MWSVFVLVRLFLMIFQGAPLSACRNMRDDMTPKQSFSLTRLMV